MIISLEFRVKSLENLSLIVNHLGLRAAKIEKNIDNFSIFAGLKISLQRMKKIRFKSLVFCVLTALVFSILAIGCHSKTNKAAEDISVLHTFPNANWTFEEQVLELPFNIEDTTKEYKIEFTLNYDTAVNHLDQLPVTVTLVFPDGQETYVSSIFDFNPETNKNIFPTGNGNNCNINLVAFPKKNLNQSGQYKIIFYRQAIKYDNYGFNSLTMKVLPLKKERR